MPSPHLPNPNPEQTLLSELDCTQKSAPGTTLNLAPLPNTKADDANHLRWNDLPSYESVLLLQGPIGPFFTKLGLYWKERGACVHKMNFNPGDDFYYSPREPNTIQYRHRLDYLEAFVQSYLTSHAIQAVFLFGEYRPIHKVMRALCNIYQVDLWVLEEGYYRPGYYTLEHNGVNANSSFATLDIDALLTSSPAIANPNATPKVYESYHYMVKWSILYWAINLLCSFSYPNYDHHRQLNAMQGVYWTRSFLRYWQYRITEHSLKKRLKSKNYFGSCDQEYFLLPLQVHDDSQMVHHSDYASLENVIEEVVSSFKHYVIQMQKQNPTMQPLLIIKHHPMDRGHRNYQLFISSLTQSLGIEKQVVYVHDIRLPLLFKNIKGCVTVNSTLGLQALFHGVPVINLGRSFYDKPRITFQGSLDQFWEHPGTVDPIAVAKFKRYIIANAQIAGCLYDPASFIT